MTRLRAGLGRGRNGVKGEIEDVMMDHEGYIGSELTECVFRQDYRCWISQTM